MVTNLTLLRTIWKSYRGLILFGTIFVALIQFLIIWIFSSLDYAPILEAIFNQLPPQFRMLFSEQFMTRLSLKGAAAFGFNHPLVLLVLGMSAIVIPTRQIAGEAENGSLEILLSLPIKRKIVYNSVWLATATILFGMISGGWCGSFLALVFAANLNMDILLNLMKICCNLWFLLILIMSYSLLFSSNSREAGKAGLTAAALTLVFYFIQFLGSIWDEIDVLLPYNIFNYYQPQKLMFGETSFNINLIFLSVLTFIIFMVGQNQFQRRDIP